MGPPFLKDPAFLLFHMIFGKAPLFPGEPCEKGDFSYLFRANPPRPPGGRKLTVPHCWTLVAYSHGRTVLLGIPPLASCGFDLFGWLDLFCLAEAKVTAVFPFFPPLLQRFFEDVPTLSVNRFRASFPSREVQLPPFSLSPESP